MKQIKNIRDWVLLPLIITSLLGLEALAAKDEHTIETKNVNVMLTTEDREQAFNSELMSNEFQSKLDVVSGSDRVSGNQALMLVSGKMSYPARYAMIDGAKKSIILSTFSIYSHIAKDGGVKDPLSRLMVEKLIAAKERGVKVLVIYDGATSVLAQSQRAIDILRDAGIKVIKFNPLITQDSELPLLASIPHGLIRMIGGQDPISNRWHEKTMIVDGTYLLSGGLNWGELYGTGNQLTAQVYSPEEFYSQPLIKELGAIPQPTWGRLTDTAWRDTDILIKGPVVTQAVERLLLDFSILDIMMGKDYKKNKYKEISAAVLQQAQEKYEKEYLTEQRDVFFNLEYLAASNKAKQEGPTNTRSYSRYISQRPYLERKLDDYQDSMEEYMDQNNMLYYNGMPGLRMTNFYLNVISKATKQIVWGCHSNRPTKDMLKALEEAAERGVKIYIIGNSKDASKTLPEDGILMYPKGFKNYKPLLKAGKGNIRIFEWQRYATINGLDLANGAFHSKVFSVDGVLTSVGSYNISKASFKKHTEGTMAVVDADFAKSAEDMFQKDLQFTREVTLAGLAYKKCSRDQSCRTKRARAERNARRKATRDAARNAAKEVGNK